MSDPQTRYINSYIDHAMGLLHEQLAQLLQTKSHLRVANEMVTEKDNIIKKLQNELEQNKTNASEKNIIAENAKKLEIDYAALKNKVAHLDSLAQQVTEMKKTIIEKDAAYNAMAGQKESAFKNMVQEKDSTITKLLQEKEADYNKTLAEKEANYNKSLIEKDELHNKTVSDKNAEIEKLKIKIAELQSSKKTINRKKPTEVSKAIVEETFAVAPVEVSEVEDTTAVLPVMLPIVQNENREQVRETDDF